VYQLIQIVFEFFIVLEVFQHQQMTNKQA